MECSVTELANKIKVIHKGGFFWIIFMYDIQHCFIYRPSDSTVSEDAAVPNPGQMRLRHWLSDALTTRLDLNKLRTRKNVLKITHLNYLYFIRIFYF
jgi:hypothetical protein